jgi:diguanylate cyclase (GGDEF)-like protein
MFLRKRAFQFTVAAGLAGLAFAGLGLLMASDQATGIAGVILLSSPVLFTAMGLYLCTRADAQEREVSEQKAQIDEAADRLAEITLAAITQHEYDVQVYDSHLPTCWEVKNCDSRDCPVYGKNNIRCWHIAGTYCGGEVQGKFAQKIGDCSKCEVYREALSFKTTSGLEENFNNLLWTVSETTNTLSTINSELRVKYAELELLQEETRRQATTDSLTGLHNYRHLNEYLKQEVANAKRYGRVLSILMLDLNDFKSINERFGFQRGDEILRLFADFLRAETDSDDYLARFGNEEFVIVRHGVDGVDAADAARQLTAKVKQVAVEGDIPLDNFSVSVGVADFPDCGMDGQSMLSAADTALFFAKNRKASDVAYFCDLTETDFTESDIDRLKSRLHGAGLDTIKALAKAVDASDQYSNEDRKILSQYADGMASKLDLDEDEAELLVLATCIHDIGKIGVPSDVLSKTGKLEPDELELVQRHPEIGEEILREARQLQELVLAILYHHERWDGSGYPEQLTGEKIPLMARVVGIFDAYRAMRCDRPYRKALSQQQAIIELRKGSGSQFDPRLVEAFVEQLEIDGQGEWRNAS